MNLFFRLIFGLISSGIAGTLIFGILFLVRPMTEKLFSKAWHYYSLLVPLFFLLGGTLIAENLIDQAQQFAAESTYDHSTLHVGDAEAQSYFNLPINPYINPYINPSYGDLPVWSYPNKDTIIPYKTDTLFITEYMLGYIGRTAPFVLAVWAVGALVFLGMSLVKYQQYRRLVLRESKICHGIDCHIPVVKSQVAHTPMLIGLIKPVIVLPWMHFEDAELDVILTHELVHYKRKDLLFKMVGQIANAVHWYNPAVYILVSQMNIFCELSCDEKVASKMDANHRRFYGETILQVLQHSATQRSLAGNLMFATNLCTSKKNIKRRLMSMMGTKKMRKSIVTLAFATGLLVVGCGFIISNLVGSVMPVYASDVTQNDIELQAELLTELLTELQTEPQDNSAMQNQFLWPLYGQGHIRITGLFGLTINPITGREEFHTGIDIPAPEGTTILAAKDGYVAFSGWLNGDFGNAIMIEHNEGYKTVYAHNLRNLVEEGQFVHQGEHIAEVGSTGIATGPHLHFEIRLDNAATDPLAYFSDEDVAIRVGRDWSEGAINVEWETTQAEATRTETRGDFPVHVIEHTERNIRFDLTHFHFNGYPAPQPVSFDTAAKIAADAIYQKFGICIDGMYGEMFFVERMYDNSWIGNLYSEELTTHAPDNNIFHFVIDAETGDVLSLYMNTEETPFR